MVNLKGATVFLCCGGPSLNGYYLELLRSAYGCVIAAVNNAPVAMWRNAKTRPHLWFSVDSPRRFHVDIFADAGCRKFVRRLFCEGDMHVGQGPREQWKSARNDVRIRHRNRWVACAPATEFPNVELYDAADDFEVDSFFHSQAPPWRKGKMCSVLLPALWLLERMQVRTINMLGCDLRMDPACPYAWDEVKSVHAAAEENERFDWLRETVLPAITIAAHERGVAINRLVPDELLPAIRKARDAEPFQFSRDLYSDG